MQDRLAATLALDATVSALTGVSSGRAAAFVRRGVGPLPCVVRMVLQEAPAAAERGNEQDKHHEGARRGWDPVGTLPRERADR